MNFWYFTCPQIKRGVWRTHFIGTHQCNASISFLESCKNVGYREKGTWTIRAKVKRLLLFGFLIGSILGQLDVKTEKEKSFLRLKFSWVFRQLKIFFFFVWGFKWRRLPVHLWFSPSYCLINCTTENVTWWPQSKPEILASTFVPGRQLIIFCRLEFPSEQKFSLRLHIFLTFLVMFFPRLRIWSQNDGKMTKVFWLRDACGIFNQVLWCREKMTENFYCWSSCLREENSSIFLLKGKTFE